MEYKIITTRERVVIILYLYSLFFLGISNNIFNYKGKNVHELVLFYVAYIDDKDYQEKYLSLNKPSPEIMKVIINRIEIHQDKQVYF